MSWFESYRVKNKLFWPNEEKKDGDRILISLVPKEKLVFLLEKLLNETEFLSPGGIRALSKYHKENPYSVTIDHIQYTIQYDPGDSTSNLFGGNSNWRGPVWMPINYLIIQSIRKYAGFYGDSLKVECPTGSGIFMTLDQVADELSRRVTSLFEKDSKMDSPIYGPYNWFYKKPG